MLARSAICASYGLPTGRSGAPSGAHYAKDRPHLMVRPVYGYQFEGYRGRICLRSFLTS